MANCTAKRSAPATQLPYVKRQRTLTEFTWARASFGRIKDKDTPEGTVLVPSTRDFASVQIVSNDDNLVHLNTFSLYQRARKKDRSFSIGGHPQDIDAENITDYLAKKVRTVQTTINDVPFIQTYSGRQRFNKDNLGYPHCLLVNVGTGFCLVDLTSGSGTWVNDQLIFGPKLLLHDDVISLGVHRSLIQLHTWKYKITDDVLRKEYEEKDIREATCESLTQAERLGRLVALTALQTKHNQRRFGNFADDCWTVTGTDFYYPCKCTSCGELMYACSYKVMRIHDDGVDPFHINERCLKFEFKTESLNVPTSGGVRENPNGPKIKASFAKWYREISEVRSGQSGFDIAPHRALKRVGKLAGYDA